MKKTYSRILALALALIMAFSLAACGSSTTSAATTEGTAQGEEATEITAETAEVPADEAQEEAEKAEMPSEITLICDGSASTKLIAEERDADTFDGVYVFAQYFEGGTQEDLMNGVRELIKAGTVSVNDMYLPTCIDEMTANEDGTYSYYTNGSAAFTAEEGTSDDDIIQMGLDAITMDVKAAGTNVTFGLDENGYAVSMALFTTRGALVEAIEDNGDGTSTVYAQGSAYTVGYGPESATVAFNNDLIDEDVEIGNICVCWQDAEGWHLKSADRMDGYLIGGADHEDYLFEDVDGTVHYFEDADMYARAFETANRPGGFVNTQNNFELTESGAYLVTAWFVPGTASTEKPMIIGFTTGDSARARLEAAIAYANNIADTAVVAASREEAGEDVNWVEDQATIDTLREAIAVAQAALDNEELTSSEIDAAVYQLHLAIWGSMSDISAVFMGTAVEGFMDIANPDQEKADPVVAK